MRGVAAFGCGAFVVMDQFARFAFTAQTGLIAVAVAVIAFGVLEVLSKKAGKIIEDETRKNIERLNKR